MSRLIVLILFITLFIAVHAQEIEFLSDHIHLHTNGTFWKTSKIRPLTSLLTYSICHDVPSTLYHLDRFVLYNPLYKVQEEGYIMDICTTKMEALACFHQIQDYGCVLGTVSALPFPAVQNKEGVYIDVYINKNQRFGRLYPS